MCEYVVEYLIIAKRTQLRIIYIKLNTNKKRKVLQVIQYIRKINKNRKRHANEQFHMLYMFKMFYMHPHVLRTHV